MSTIRCEKLGVMMRLHNRPEYILSIFNQIRTLTRGREALVAISIDRPSIDVLTEINATIAGLPENITVFVTQPPRPVVSLEGTFWMESVQPLLEIIRDAGCDVGTSWDDDILYTAPALQEVRAHLEFFDHDRVDAEWLHVFEDEQHYDSAFPQHMAAMLFRIYPDDDFRTDNITHSPARCSKSENCATLHHNVLHYGYLTTEARRDSFRRLTRAGKIDGHVLQLVKEPRISAIRTS